MCMRYAIYVHLKHSLTFERGDYLIGDRQEERMRACNICVMGLHR